MSNDRHRDSYRARLVRRLLCLFFGHRKHYHTVEKMPAGHGIAYWKCERCGAGWDRRPA